MTLCQNLPRPSTSEPTTAGSSPDSHMGDVDVEHTDTLAARALAQSHLNVAPATPTIDRLISFACNVVIPSKWPQENSTNEPLYEYAQMWQTITGTAQDICFANAYFAVMSGLLARRSRNSIITATWMTRQSYQFQTKAIEILRSRTQNALEMRSPYTFRAILYLFISETVFDNFIQARTHLRMLQNLVNELLGGVNALDPWLRENLLSADVFFAIKSETRPLLPSSEWSPGPLNSTWRSRTKTAILPSLSPSPAISPSASPGVKTTLKTRRIPISKSTTSAPFPSRHSSPSVVRNNPDLVDILKDLTELSEAYSYVQNTRVAADEPLLRWVQLRRYDLLSRLTDLRVDTMLKPRNYTYPECLNVVCGVLVLWMLIEFGSPEPMALGQKLVKRVWKELQSTTSHVNGKSTADHKISPLRGVEPGALKVWVMYVLHSGARVFLDIDPRSHGNVYDKEDDRDIAAEIKRQYREARREIKITTTSGQEIIDHGIGDDDNFETPESEERLMTILKRFIFSARTHAEIYSNDEVAGLRSPLTTARFAMTASTWADATAAPAISDLRENGELETTAVPGPSSISVSYGNREVEELKGLLLACGCSWRSFRPRPLSR